MEAKSDFRKTDMSFEQSYLGQLRALVGQRRLSSVGARVLIEHDTGRFLTIKRSDDGLWGIPGGGKELGETMLDVVHREAWEEARAKLRDVTPFGLSTDPEEENHTYPNGDQIQSVSLMTHAYLTNGDVASDQIETVDLRFASMDEIADLPFVKPERRIFEL